MKCKNCGHLLWRATERDYAPNTPKEGEIYYVWWHDWKHEGVYHKCSCGCVNPQPQGEKGDGEKK